MNKHSATERIAYYKNLYLQAKLQTEELIKISSEIRTQNTKINLEIKKAINSLEQNDTIRALEILKNIGI